MQMKSASCFTNQKTSACWEAEIGNRTKPSCGLQFRKERY